ncbi:DUF6446 family protein [Tropicimonas sp. IMCC34043]|uniref:DUF6446 family protein n=1 Tax=Tropicimonas sp. IMCC34043 TaxID=2248760 RepID=UPI000E239224|nr:DUF6446 family protein [Tropicimonas sp. IMCC34043]
MSGKIIAGGIVVIALLFGVAVYYFQEFYYYRRVEPAADEIALTALAGGVAPIPAAGVQAIDASSSPIRYRACFTTQLALADLEASYRPYPAAEPLNAPFWFECFDAKMVGAALESGQARAFLGTADIHRGVDRVVAVLPDGRGFVWHQVNGEIAH